MMAEAPVLLDVDQEVSVEELADDASIQQPDEKPSTENIRKDEEEEEAKESSDEDDEPRDDRLCRFYRPLHKAALNGDWESAKSFLIDHEEAKITQGVNRMNMTILHIAANMGHAVFIRKLVQSRFFHKEALKLKDDYEFTALHYAASVGSLSAVKFLVSQDKSLTQIEDDDGDIPLCSAADNTASREVLWYLAKESADNDEKSESGPFSGVKGADLITSLVAVGHYDICLYLFNRYRHLASDSVSLWREDPNYDLLGCLVCRPSEFPRRSKLSFWESCIYHLIQIDEPRSINSNSGAVHPQQTSMLSTTIRSKMSKVIQGILGATSKYAEYMIPLFKHIRDQKYKHKCIIELLNVACKTMSEWDINEIVSYFKKNEVHYDAAKQGGTEIIRAFMEHFPDIMDDYDVEGEILTQAIQNRQESIFNIMMERGITVKFLPDKVNKEEDNALHSVARLAPYTRLSSVSCPALQMQRELQWFKGVEKFVPASFKILQNKEGATPRELFTTQHKDLVRDGERWLKDTSNSCLVVATLIITVVFAAAFTIPGGNIDGTGIPLFLRERSFVLFVTSDAVGMFSSATSILMFLSILTARYAEDDFLYALPKRLILGLVSLWIAIASMMVAFGATLYMILDPRYEWIIFPIIGMTCVPVGLFIMLQLPLIIFMVRSTYGPSILKDKIVSVK